MTITHGKILRWLLSGGTFFAVVSLAGCAAHTASSPQEISATRPTAAKSFDPHQAVIAFDTIEGLKPPIINVFGELDGNQAGPPRAFGEAGIQQQTFLDEGHDGDVSVDPTGKWMVFASTRNSEHPNIYMQRADGMSVIQLTNDEADYAYPTFSPDGKQIAFCSTRAGNWDIYVMDTEGKSISQVTTGPMQHIHPSFSPDGTKLVFSALGGRSGQWELWTADLATGEKRMIGFGLFPSWSPQKGVNRIAFQRARQRGGRWFSLWTLDLIDGEAHRMTELAVSSNAAIVAPSWSPDGQQLSFATIAEPTSTAGIKPVGQQDIWIINSDGSNRRRLTDGVAMNLSPCWANDGRVYFISDRSGCECIWSVKAGASAPAPKPAGVAAAAPVPHGTDAVGSTEEAGN